ncbi:hypothetical protein Q7689_33995, partial [Nocardiopsis tropica]|nr:hypothetical protein [Nocardiopsis tropica]
MRNGPLRTAAPGPDGFDVGSDPIGEGGVCLVRLFTGFLTAASAEVLRKGAGTSGDRSDAPEEDDGVRVRLDELSARRGTTLTG